jgi:hypothetical protein
MIAILIVLVIVVLVVDNELRKQRLARGAIESYKRDRDGRP